MSSPGAPEVPRRAVVRLVRFGFEDRERAARLLSDPSLGLWDLERNEPADPEAGPAVSPRARAGDLDLAHPPRARPARLRAGPRRRPRPRRPLAVPAGRVARPGRPLRRLGRLAAGPP